MEPDYRRSWMSLKPLCRPRLLNFVQAQTWTPGQESIQVAVCHPLMPPPCHWSPTVFPAEKAVQEKEKWLLPKLNTQWITIISFLQSSWDFRNMWLLPESTLWTKKWQNNRGWGTEEWHEQIGQRTNGWEEKAAAKSQGGSPDWPRASHIRDGTSPLCNHTVHVESMLLHNPLPMILKPETLLKLFYCNPVGSKITPDLNWYETIYSLSITFRVDTLFLLQKKQSLNMGSCPTPHCRICVMGNILMYVVTECYWVVKYQGTCSLNLSKIWSPKGLIKRWKALIY